MEDGEILEMMAREAHLKVTGNGNSTKTVSPRTSFQSRFLENTIRDTVFYNKKSNHIAHSRRVSNEQLLDESVKLETLDQEPKKKKKDKKKDKDGKKSKKNKKKRKHEGSDHSDVGKIDTKKIRT